MRWPIFMISLTFLALTLGAGCDADGGAPSVQPGTVALAAEQGVDFHAGARVEPGNFANSDLYASRNGTALKLATGGPSPVVNHPVNWFMGANGLHRTFASIDEVPSEPPSDAMTDSLVRARAGNGFVLRTHRGVWVRGWIASADADEVTITWAPLQAE